MMIYNIIIVVCFTGIAALSAIAGYFLGVRDGFEDGLDYERNLYLCSEDDQRDE